MFKELKVSVNSDNVVLSFNDKTVTVLDGPVTLENGRGLSLVIFGKKVTLLMTTINGAITGGIDVNETMYSVKEYIEHFGDTTTGRAVLARFVNFASRVGCDK